ncbi:gamma-butyrobetaine hydroxylase-like domain-containing protein [Aggregatilinea lenta]|uniref:gamma-butyrobetaine hydroxylase-like domain-containing protein n=1 Tax=Aggregatilinea lenta TaxID=913108 RepID=UPI000E5ABD70|nr:DUF971 domain-containing protein [Aggregatilinea lenta]
MAVIPTNITLNQKSEELIIEWSTGRTCSYPLGPLRLACPCVQCRGGHEKMGREHDPKSLKDLIPLTRVGAERVELVGNYALQFFWSDGHNTGIYTWDYLYRLCPAEESEHA